MKKIERFFDINMVLMTIYVALESIREEKKIELVYDIDATIPKELKGDVESVTHVLTQLLTFVFQNTESKEIIFSLQAPKDFLYEESINFVIEDLDMSSEKVESFFEARLKLVLGRIEGTASYEYETGKLVVSIPFKLNDLGNRRYYRLPDMGMLGKKVLLISQSKIVAESIRKMFQYFLYEVDAGSEEYKQHGSNLAYYDIFVLEDTLVTEEIELLVRKVQEKHDLKFVILEDAARVHMIDKKHVSAYLIKPVMQESIYELIVSLYASGIQDIKIKKAAGKPIINMDKYIINAFEKSEEAYLEMEKIKERIEQARKKAKVKSFTRGETEATHLLVLNVEKGMEKAKKTGIDYRVELKKFLEKFDRSDLYFRDIVKSKASWQIKEFAIDLEKHASSIGAERIANLAEKISLLFVYNNLDMLPVYTGKYHLELKKLFGEIKRYLEKN